MLIGILAVMLLVLEGGLAAHGRRAGPPPSSAANEQTGVQERSRGVEGCATEHGCESFFEIRIPPGTDPAKFSPRLLVELTISSKGKVERVTVKKSSGIKEVDEKILKIIRQWRFKEEKSARETTAVVSLHVR